MWLIFPANANPHANAVNAASRFGWSPSSDFARSPPARTMSLGFLFFRTLYGCADPYAVRQTLSSLDDSYEQVTQRRTASSLPSVFSRFSVNYLTW